MKKDPQVLLLHIAESIRWVENDVKELSKVGFLKNVPIQDAVIRRIEIIGEAVRNLPVDIKQAYPETPWLDIADMRNKLIHEYFDVDLDLVWEVIKRDIPELKKQIEKLIDNRNKQT